MHDQASGIEAKTFYIRRSEIGGPIECIITYDKTPEPLVFILTLGQLANLVLEGTKIFLRPYHNTMWDQKFQYPERIGMTNAESGD